MAQQRIKGQEVEVILVVNGAAENTTTDVRSFEVTAKLEKKEEGYLGEKTNRYDEIMNGVDGTIEFHYENADIFNNILLPIINRAQRRTPGTLINIKAALNFPGGDRPRLMFSNVFFGPVPIGFGSRSDYGTVRLDFSCSDIAVL